MERASRQLAGGYPHECLEAVAAAARSGADDADADRRLLVESAWECASRGVLAAPRGALTARDFATLASAVEKLFPIAAETAPLPAEAAPAVRALAEAGGSPHFLT